MKHIFYMFTLLFILWEWYVATNTKKVIAFVDIFRDTPTEKFDTKKHMYLFFQTIYIIWNFIGLFSFQWPAFLLMFLMGFIHKKPLWVKKLDAWMTVIILFFIVLNAYHFNINIYKYFAHGVVR